MTIRAAVIWNPAWMNSGLQKAIVEVSLQDSKPQDSISSLNSRGSGCLSAGLARRLHTIVNPTAEL